MNTSSAKRTAAHRVRIGAAALVALIATILVVPQAASAATVTVCADGCAHTTIAAAITAATAGDTITIAAGNYAENLTIDKDLTLQGAGAESTTMAGGGAFPAGRVVHVNGAFTVAISGVAIRFGDVDAGNGAGILNSGGTLSITNSTISNNRATALQVDGVWTGGNGGGVYNDGGTLNITSSKITSNIATALGDHAIGDGGDGGGIYNAGTLRVTGSTIDSNSAFRAGGIWHESGPLAVVDRSVVVLNVKAAHDPPDPDSGSQIHAVASMSATQNWWGSATGPAAGMVTNPSLGLPVDVDPWLESVQMSASLAEAPVGGEVTITATVRDSDGADAAGGTSGLLVARFTRTGANAGTQDVAFATTAAHTYTGATTGTDTVTAVVLFDGAASTLTGQTSVNWVEDFNLLPGDPATLTVCASGCDHTTIAAAITAANVGDTIDIAAGTYTEALSVSKRLTLRGAGQAITIIQADAAPNTATTRVITITNQAIVNIQGVTIRHGNVTGENGGGISNDLGTLSIAASTITGNTATGAGTDGGWGGGIFNSGTLTITDSTFSNNSATRGAGIGQLGGGTTMTGSTVDDNEASGCGGGLASASDPDDSAASTLTIVDSAITDNTVGNGVAGCGGGGIINENGSTLAVTDSTISGNGANYGGGISNYGADGVLGTFMTVTGSTIASNTANCDGGGIWTGQGGSQELSTATITNSTIADNVANAACLVDQGDGGGIYHWPDGTLTVTGSAITGNTARDGGGVYNAATADVSRSALINNSATRTGNAIHHANGTASQTRNWWGVDTGPAAGAITGTVTSGPWLASVGLVPSDATPPGGTQVTVTATLLDSDAVDAGASPLLASFTRTGANPGTADVAFASTAPHAYTGSSGGADTVTAAVLFGGAALTLSGQTTVTWDPPPSITTTTLPGWTVGVAGYSQTPATSGGLTPYAWSVSAGALPTGLSLNAGTGAITGTPTAEGSFSFTIQITDDAGATGARALSIAINAGPAPSTPSPSPTPTPSPAPSTGVEQVAAPGETVSTLPVGASVSEEAPAGASVTTPTGGSVSIAVESGAVPDGQAGFSMLGLSVVVSAPAASPEAPLAVGFHLHPSLWEGLDPSTVVPQRNGVAVADCADPDATAAEPDPCVGPRTIDGDGNLMIVVRTSAASTWTFGVAVACPPAGFADVAAGGVHAGSVDCAALSGIAHGYPDGTFRAGEAVRRDQMASFVVRTLEAAGHTLPAPEHTFADLTGSVHADAVGALAAAGIVDGIRADAYDPAGLVRRDQMAAFLVRAADWAGVDTTVAGGGPFADVAGNTHEAAIDAAFELGLTVGTSATAYDPAGVVARGQMATFLVRLLDRL